MDLRFTHTLISFALLIGFLSFSQEESSLVYNDVKTDSTDFSFYREDQIYLGVSFIALDTNKENFDARGLSSHFQWGLVRDFPIDSSGQFALGVGLGMGFERYNTNLNRTVYQQTKGLYTLNDDPTVSPLFFSIQSLELPLSLRWRSSSSTDYAFWRIYGGIAFQWNYRVRAKQDTVVFPVKTELHNLGATAHLSFGYNTWNFYLAYRLTPFFKMDLLSPQTLPIELTPIKVGLIFYLL